MSKQIIEVNPDQAVALVSAKADSISEAMELKVVSTPTYEQAGVYMGQVREAKTLLKDKKKTILDPLKAVKEATEKLFEPAEEKIGVIELYLKSQIDGYRLKLQKEADERAKEAEKKIEKGATITEATKKLTNTQEKINVIPTRKVWRVKITDFVKVPNEFKLLNESKALESAKLGVKVEGLEFYQDEITVNRY
uniref:Uncharacterized protein n=1 Tax=viral metagenome TaxID=1070528 RepID=A0A6H1ZG26_9ZZZZ